VTVGLPALDGGARRIPGLRFHNPPFPSGGTAALPTITMDKKQHCPHAPPRPM
jgi:hypothetical protein